MYCGTSAAPVLTNCTVTGNNAQSGGALYCETSLNPHISNCILWSDTPREIYISSGTPLVTYSDVKAGFSGTGNLNTDPLFADPNNGDYHLAANSPCVDAGDPASDYSLEPEPDGGRINMGAYGNTAEAECKGGLNILGYVPVGKTRVGTMVFEYQLKLRIKNTSTTAVTGVQAQLLQMYGNVTIMDGLVENVGTIPAGATVTSSDTFAIRVDRSALVSPLAVSWQVTYSKSGRVEQRTLAGFIAPGDLELQHAPQAPIAVPAGIPDAGAPEPAPIETGGLPAGPVSAPASAESGGLPIGAAPAETTASSPPEPARAESVSLPAAAPGSSATGASARSR